MTKFIRIACLSLCAIVPAVAARAEDTAKLDKRIEAAHEVLHEIMTTPDKGIPDSIAEHATCVAVIPGFKKGAFLVGAEYGQGVVTCRTGHGWSAPAFIKLTGGSFGLQAGGQSTDLILVAVTKSGFDHLLADKVKLGGDISVAAGPVGRASTASTTELANAGFLSYSRNKGIFAGVDLNGDVVNQNTDDTITYYGHDASFQSILSGKVAPHASSLHFIRTVAQLFHQSGAH
jgi:lipid-binding SYLF domain-containing protein